MEHIATLERWWHGIHRLSVSFFSIISIREAGQHAVCINHVVLKPLGGFNHLPSSPPPVGLRDRLHRFLELTAKTITSFRSASPLSPLRVRVILRPSTLLLNLVPRCQSLLAIQQSHQALQPRFILLAGQSLISDSTPLMFSYAMAIINDFC